MSEKKNITKQELSKVKYGQLLEKFTELGVPEAWKAGSKKIVMIEKAIELYKIKQNLEQEGLSKEEVETKVVEIEQEREVLKQTEELKKAIEVEEKEKKAQEKTKELNLTKEQIEYNIKNIDANLIQCTDQQRFELIKKKDFLLELLDKI